MAALSTMSTASSVSQPPTWSAAWITYHLAQNPANGGMPVSDSMNSSIRAD